MMKMNIDIGTNELEVLEFSIDGNYFGINLAKVRELICYQTVQRIPNSQPSIEGIIRSRDELFTVLDLADYLNFAASKDPEHDILIITDFNHMSLAFHVHTVEGIIRTKWDKIEKPCFAIYGDREGVVTGIVKLENRMITLIDFEKIMYEINPNSLMETNIDRYIGEYNNYLNPILIAEDSPMLNKMIIEALHKAGYQNIIKTSNGQEAWDYLQTVKEKSSVACVITDIEMPYMDGYYLTKLIKEDSILSSIPVIVFSTLITDAMKEKGKKVGANALLSKPEIGKLVATLSQILNEV